MNRALIWVFVLAPFLSGCAVHQTIAPAHSPPSGDGWEIQNTISPELKKFLNKNSVANAAFMETYYWAFAGKQVRLYYFYCDDESQPRAFHFYRGEGLVNIAVRKNQHALDEYVSILFEMINSTNETSFLKLARDAEAGRVSRSEFPLRALEIEHSSVCQTRDLIARLPFAEEDIGDSQLYHAFLESPNEFRDFVAYIQKDGSRRDAVQIYLDQYDANVKR